uniref:Ig-like domain-containing protein n=1 Tax=Pelusios castaneus TaxID=367368 RepID=A0A8C8VFV4_9SAUR
SSLSFWAHGSQAQASAQHSLAESHFLSVRRQLMGPGTVRGPPGGSVAVRCQYQTGYEEYPKFWCRAGGGTWSCPEGPLVESSGTEAKVKRGRVSIQDNHPQHAFTVTVENLTLADAGTYRCGIWRGLFLRAHIHAVTVIVSPGKSRLCSHRSLQAGSSSGPGQPVPGFKGRLFHFQGGDPPEGHRWVSEPGQNSSQHCHF